MSGPKNAVSVELLGRVEPEAVPLLPAAVRASVSVQIRLKPPWLSLNVPQELEV